MEITMEQLESLLNEQKRKVVQELLNGTGQYNKESTGGVYKILPIDEEKFTKKGMSASFPNDILTLKKYSIQ